MRALLPVLLLSLAACAGPGLRGAERLGPALARSAREQVGRPYRDGGSAPEKGFDCSGLAWWVHHRNGVEIPRTSFQQYRAGRKVRPSRLLAGDLVFFSTYKRGPSHVGVVLDADRFVHAPKTGHPVRVDRLSDRYWKSRYLGARRYR